MKGKTLYIIIGVLVVIVLAYFLFFKKSAQASTNGVAEWNKAVKKHYDWLVKQKYVAEKAKTNGKTVEEQAMDDARYLAEKNDGLTDPNK